MGELLTIISQKCIGQVIRVQHLARCCSDSLLFPIQKIPVGGYVLSFVWIRLAYTITTTFSGDTTASALTAVFTANVVLVAYIVVSVQEENKAKAATTTTEETKKTR